MPAGPSEPFGQRAQVAGWAGSPRTTRTSGRRMDISTLRPLGTRWRISRRDGLGDGEFQGRVLAVQEPGGDVERVLVEPLGLCGPTVSVGVVRGREERETQQLCEPAGFQGAVPCHERQRVADPAPGLAREGEIGREMERPGPVAGGRDRKRHADGGGTLRQGSPGGVPPLGRGKVPERPCLAVVVGDLGVDARDAVEAVIPLVAFEAPVGLEEPLGHADAFRGAPQRLRLGGLGIAVDDQRVRASRRGLRRLPPVVDVGNGRPPGTEHPGRRHEVDAGVAGPCPVGKGGTGLGLGGHGAVDRQAGRLTHPGQKAILHRFAAGGQHEFESGAVHDIGADGPVGAVNGVDHGQADGHGQAEEVQVRLHIALPAVPVDAEGESVPCLGMDGAVEEGPAFQRLAFERDRQWIVTRRTGEGGADHVGGLGSLEPYGRAGWIGRAVVAPHQGVAPAGEVFRFEVHEPTLPGRAVGRACARRYPAAVVGKAQDPHAGGVLAGHKVVIPAVLAEAQQDGGVLDAGAVVGDGHRKARFGRLGRAAGRDWKVCPR